MSISRGHAFIELAKTKFPGLELVEVDSLQEGLSKIDKGELFGHIGSLVNAYSYLQSHQLLNFRVSRSIYSDWGLSLGVRDDDEVLLGIFEKAVKSVSDEENKKIYKKWVSVEYDGKYDYEMIKKIVSLSILVFFVLVVWGFVIRRKNKLLQNSQEKIQIKNEKLTLLASIDKLTGLLNRLKLDEVLDAQIKNYNNLGDDFGVIMIDIDFFKSINDTYGHQMGDDVLKAVAEVLKQGTRSSDIVGRWGGEEFLIVCLGVNEDKLMMIAQKLRESIESIRFPHEKQLTCSFGVSLVKEGDELLSILKRADNALYASKKNGRNMVSFL